MHTSIPGAVGTLFALDMAVKQYIEENVSEKEEKNLLREKSPDQKSIQQRLCI